MNDNSTRELKTSSGTTMRLTTISPGYMTTEFWINVLPILGTFILLGARVIEVSDVSSLFPVFMTTSAYAIGRSIAKVKS